MDINIFVLCRSPRAKISKIKTITELTPASRVAAFSSRGLPEESIIKPDVIAPGVDILASWLPKDNTKRAFEFSSGTSMSTPQVAAIVAMLKTLHPTWSPAMIKSAIMTTASPLDNTGKPIKDYNGDVATHYAIGSGFINPRQAIEPGLVLDYTGNYENCIDDCNYPSIVVDLSGVVQKVVVNRTFTLVSFPPLPKDYLLYHFLKHDIPPELNVDALRYMSFDLEEGQRIVTTSITFSLHDTDQRIFGSLLWKCYAHPGYNVRIPFVVKT
ncbi:hypothetical protein SELMODRAFT_132821 [Selaginella moellendorffii]|uniref:Peptidase S8/S53 domain-containing protein n=1 Tax=Selaginella moellendorffii TaxID=88036 RepID=D8T5Z0_SELML|nr:hypothetical protein SELMODRAFT_132821 [Selaginella moellendorffii]